MAKAPIEGSDYIVRVLDFPDATVGGSVVEDSEGFHNIYINARRTTEAQRESFIHELRHIARDDFHNDLSIAEVEDESADQPDPMLISYDTVEEYAHYVEEELGITLNLSDDARIEDVHETVAFLKTLRDPWKDTE